MNDLEVLSVSRLTHIIKQKIETLFSHVAVRGEVSNLRKQPSGHLYFTLKDTDAQMPAVLFRGQASLLSQLPKEGDEIVAKGHLSLYAPRGTYQLIIREIDFTGVGQLLQKLHLLKIKLQQLGWFEASCKKPLPKIPKTIGVITSPTGAVIQDILQILHRRYSGFHLILNPVKVQGNGAAEEIAKAIYDFNHHKLADVLIVGRGGGSLEDLWPFNEEIVAKAIYDSTIPIISAVGHETDFTLADFVADLRAPTPSAAAELVIVEKRELQMQLSKGKSRLLQMMQQKVLSYRKIFSTLLKHQLLQTPDAFLHLFFQKIDWIKEDIKKSLDGQLLQKKQQLFYLIKRKESVNPRAQIASLHKNFSKYRKDLIFAMKQQILQKKAPLKQLTNHLVAIHPQNLLQKGYSIIFHEKKDSVILSLNDLQQEECLRIQVSDGQFLAIVKEKI